MVRPVNCIGWILKAETLDAVTHQAYEWLCKSYAHRGANSDCWHFRHHKNTLLPQITDSLRQMNHLFSPRQQYRFPDETYSLYCSADSLVLKVMSLALSEYLHINHLISPQCYHVKHHGGLKAAVRDTKANLNQYRYIFKSDIKGFYEHIDHDILLEDLLSLTGDQPFVELVGQSLKVPSTWGGLYYSHEKGLPRGSPLSPLLGAVALHRLDAAMQAIKGVFYVRFMDDWVVLCKTKHALKKIVRCTYQVLGQLKFDLHPDKTYIGKIDKGFDFLGYHFDLIDLSLAKATLDKAIARLQQLFEQGASNTRLAEYWRRFIQWAHAAVVLSQEISITPASMDYQTRHMLH
jgi:RNA-directed DNA polymerase